MRRKPLALILIALMVVSAFLAGCRKSAVPPVEELTPEEEATAMQEAQENTDEMQATPEETEEATVAPEETETSTPEAVETEAPTPEPTATTEVAAPTPVPTAEPTAAPTAPETTGATTYVVKPGDNLFRISLRFNTTVQAIAQANNITNPSMVYVGQTLTIPAGGGGATTPPPSSQQCSVIYTVKPGDNLFRIALRYNYSQYYLAQVNGISNPSLVQVGQELCIP